MVPVAGVTEIVRPQLDKLWKEGIEEGVNKVAKGMKAANISLDLIQKSTGLSIEKIKKL